jgi:5-deoxy-glucuronate isomerase
MPQYTSSNLVIHPGTAGDPGLIVEVSPEQAGWETIHFQARRLARGQRWSFTWAESELALVVLSGTIDIETSRGSWSQVGTRASVFSGLPSALYLPPRTSLTVTAASDCEFALAWVPPREEHPPRLIRPEDVTVELRGGDHASRHINSLLPPGFPCARLVVVEVYTPGGNWSSYPPHKHDVHRVDADGRILEADLDEIYYYKIDRPEGYALQRIYTAPDSPLQRAGTPINTAVIAQNDDVVLIPEGYHPVSSPVGYTTYYLNVLAGSAQSLAASDDPGFAWVKGSYASLDPRVPVYPVPGFPSIDRTGAA